MGILKGISDIIGVFTLTDFFTPLENTASDIKHSGENTKIFFINALDLGYVQKLLKSHEIEYWSAERVGPLAENEAHFTVKEADQGRVNHLLGVANIRKRY